jgi:putative membrane protein
MLGGTIALCRCFVASQQGDLQMNRRNILKSTVALAVMPAVLGSAAAAQDANAEKKHAEDTKRVGSLSLATSRLAVQKASDAMVKAFAGWEVAEQETIADILKSMESDGRAEGALEPPTAAKVETMLDAEGKAVLEKLNAASGAAFDKAYLIAQLDGHKKLLAIQEHYLKAGDNREHLSVTKLARGQIKEHIDHLDKMSKAG